MLSRRIVAARPMVRAIGPAVAWPRPQFTQIRTALTNAEMAELADPNQVSRTHAQGAGNTTVDADSSRTAATSILRPRSVEIATHTATTGTSKSAATLANHATKTMISSVG